ncbi:P-loop_containing nucleoside triphosphate hydrolase [Hexamita inflata]|uniref:P-loop containing nucleoside triphosphate hydrolase n=1 Tax=Hexamita inflata TaxID=28002 RepID=A0AA86UYU3_9EUKA|nr:P-loop containing nucleoside triphosphate hydrolase [Hexamita inflata]
MIKLLLKIEGNIMFSISEQNSTQQQSIYPPFSQEPIKAKQQLYDFSLQFQSSTTNPENLKNQIEKYQNLNFTSTDLDTLVQKLSEGNVIKKSYETYKQLSQKEILQIICDLSYQTDQLDLKLLKDPFNIIKYKNSDNISRYYEGIYSLWIQLRKFLLQKISGASQKNGIINMFGAVKSGKTLTAKLMAQLIKIFYKLFVSKNKSPFIEQCKELYLDLQQLEVYSSFKSKLLFLTTMICNELQLVYCEATLKLMELDELREHFLNVVKGNLNCYHIIIFDEYHKLYSNLSFKDKKLMSDMIKTMTVGQEAKYQSTFIFSGSTTIVHTWALSYSAGNGSSLLSGGVNIQTDYQSSDFELQDSYLILKMTKTLIALEEMQRLIKQYLKDIKCSTMFYLNDNNIDDNTDNVEYFTNIVLEHKTKIFEIFQQDIVSFCNNDPSSKQLVSFSKQYVVNSNISYYSYQQLTTVPQQDHSAFLTETKTNGKSYYQLSDKLYSEFISIFVYEQYTDEINTFINSVCVYDNIYTYNDKDYVELSNYVSMNIKNWDQQVWINIANLLQEFNSKPTIDQVKYSKSFDSCPLFWLQQMRNVQSHPQASQTITSDKSYIQRLVELLLQYFGLNYNFIMFRLSSLFKSIGSYDQQIFEKHSQQKNQFSKINGIIESKDNISQVIEADDTQNNLLNITVNFYRSQLQCKQQTQTQVMKQKLIKFAGYNIYVDNKMKSLCDSQNTDTDELELLIADLKQYMFVDNARKQIIEEQIASICQSD